MFKYLGIALIIVILFVSYAVAKYSYWNNLYESMPKEWEKVRIGMTRLEYERSVRWFMEIDQRMKLPDYRKEFRKVEYQDATRHSPPIHRRRWRIKVTFSSGKEYEVISTSDKAWNERMMDVVVNYEAYLEEDSEWKWLPYPHTRTKILQ